MAEIWAALGSVRMAHYTNTHRAHVGNVDVCAVHAFRIFRTPARCERVREPLTLSFYLLLFGII